MEGIINIYKDRGITSFDIIRKLRRILKMKRIGHTGTLDPLAQGVVVVCIGRSTKLASLIESKTKEYIFEITFGKTTNTYDAEGEFNNQKDIQEIDKDIVEKSLDKFRGKIEQIPPMFSAIKINGEKLYNLARKNIVVERKPRNVEIFDLKLLEMEKLTAKFITQVSKGTYIRSLVQDIGDETNYLGYMTYLERTRVGEYLKEDSFTLEIIENMVENSDFTFVKSVENSFQFNKISLDDDYQYKLFRNGLSVKNNYEPGFKRVYYNDNFIGIGNVNEYGVVKGYKYF